MSIVMHRDIKFERMVGDPDDHRPNSTWALIADPDYPDRDFVDGLTVLREYCAAGDRIPLHTHPIDEVILIRYGAAEVRVGDLVQNAGDESVVFIPRGTPHGIRNIGPESLELDAVFPSSKIGITYIERNPAPGTEKDAPQPPFTFDARAPGNQTT